MQKQTKGNQVVHAAITNKGEKDGLLTWKIANGFITPPQAEQFEQMHQAC